VLIYHFVRSSDLWVTGAVPNSTDTGTAASISYAIGEASGTGGQSAGSVVKLMITCYLRQHLHRPSDLFRLHSPRTSIQYVGVMTAIRHSHPSLSNVLVGVQNTSSFGAIAALGINGLAGLGPSFSSVIRNKIGTKGETLLDNIFQVNAILLTPSN
jgi:hypothetical protein